MLNFCDFIRVYVFTTNHHLKENAHMLYWKSVDHVQTHRSEARTQRRGKSDCL